jgi:hypothetical protein
MAGHSGFLLKRGHERAKRREKAAAQVLPDLQGNGLSAAKKHFSYVCYLKR